MWMPDSKPGRAGRWSADRATAGPGRAAGSLERLDRLREQVSECDRELIEVLSRRRGLVREVGKLKARLGFPVTDPRREAAVVRRAAEMARAAGLDEELIRDLIWKIMSASRDQQYEPPAGEESPD